MWSKLILYDHKYKKILFFSFQLNCRLLFNLVVLSVHITGTWADTNKSIRIAIIDRLLFDAVFFMLI